MTLAGLETIERELPSPADVEAARDASHALLRLTGAGGVRVEGEGEHGALQGFVLPPAAVALLADALAGLAQGRRVVVVAEDAELTTQQAADLLNVSRPYLIGLLEAGKIAHRKVGTHRRIPLGDLLAYRRARKAKSALLMRELAAEAQELGMGY